MSHPQPENLTEPEFVADVATPPRVDHLDQGPPTPKLGFLAMVDARSARASEELAALAGAELDVDDDVLGLVVGDIDAASWWSSMRDSAMERAGALYRWFKSVVFGAAAGGALVYLSDGPMWLAALFIAFSLLAAVSPESDREVGLLIGLVGVAGTGIALLAQLIDDVNVWQGLLALPLAAVIGVAVAVAADAIIFRLATSVTVDLVILLGLGVALTLALQSLPWEGWPVWTVRGATAGLVAGLVTGALFALTDLVSRLVSKVIDGIKMRHHAEAEFVQSCIWALGGLATTRAVPEGDQQDQDVDPTPVTSEFYGGPWQRADMVGAAEYLTGVLEHDVCAALVREDHAGHAFVEREIARRAAVLRSNKRAVLLGQPNAAEEFAATVRSAAVQGSMRRWHELPTLSAEEEADARPARRERAAKVLHGVTILAIPVVLAGYGWQSKDPALLSSGAIWVGVVAVDMLAPGTRRDVKELTGDVRNFLPGGARP